MPAPWIAASRSAIAAGVPAIVSSRSASSRPSGDGATRTQPVRVTVAGSRPTVEHATSARSRNAATAARLGERAVVVDRVAPARGDLHRARLAAGDPDRRSAGGRPRGSDVGIGDRVEAALERRRAVADQSSDDLDRLAEPRHVGRRVEAERRPAAVRRPAAAAEPQGHAPAAHLVERPHHRREQRRRPVARAGDQRPDPDRRRRLRERREDRPALPEAGLVGDPERVHAERLGIAPERADRRPSRRRAVGPGPRRGVEADLERHRGVTTRLTVTAAGRACPTAGPGPVLRVCKTFAILARCPAPGRIEASSTNRFSGERRCPGPAVADVSTHGCAPTRRPRGAGPAGLASNPSGRRPRYPPSAFGTTG